MTTPGLSRLGLLPMAIYLLFAGTLGVLAVLIV